MEKDLINTTLNERVTSTYCEIYFDEAYNKNIVPNRNKLEKKLLEKNTNEWMSPSDTMVGKVDLYAPFTSRVFRGITHEGVLAIGQGVLDKERKAFLKHLNELLSESNETWKYILEQELKPIAEEVKTFYDNIFLHKSQVTQEEIATFYEDSLHDLERHLRQEIKAVLISSHGNLIRDLNQEIKIKLKLEKNKLESILIKRNHAELQKIKTYYNILLYNQRVGYEKNIRTEIVNRNDTVSAYCKLLESTTTVSTMYVLSMERKRCKIKQFLLNSYQSAELRDTLNQIKDRQEAIDTLADKDIPIPQLNREWEERITKILQLFLKFISFCLKILPEQSTFLLDFEKLVVLQLNEMIKAPGPLPPIGIVKEEDELKNVFKFEHDKLRAPYCSCKGECHCICGEPFHIIGDLSDLQQPGPDEELASDASLPTITVDKRFVYARCHDYNEIRENLDVYKYRCRCREIRDEDKPDIVITTQEEPVAPALSLDSLLPPEKFKLLQTCPDRQCPHLDKTITDLGDYLDFTEEKFLKVKDTLENPRLNSLRPKTFEAKDALCHGLPFTETTEPHHTVSTQYSSQENLYEPKATCICADKTVYSRDSLYKLPETSHDILDAILLRRKESLRRVLERSPNLRKIFTDESFTFQY